MCNKFIFECHRTRPPIKQFDWDLGENWEEQLSQATGEKDHPPRHTALLLAQLSKSWCWQDTRTFSVSFPTEDDFIEALDTNFDEHREGFTKWLEENYEGNVDDIFHWSDWPAEQNDEQDMIDITIN